MVLLHTVNSPHSMPGFVSNRLKRPTAVTELRRTKGFTVGGTTCAFLVLPFKICHFFLELDGEDGSDSMCVCGVGVSSQLWISSGLRSNINFACHSNVC